MCLPLERLWKNVDVTFHSYPPLEKKQPAADDNDKTDGELSSSDADHDDTKPERYDHLRDKRLDEELQIKRAPNRPSGSKSKKKKPKTTTDAGEATAAAPPPTEPEPTAIVPYDSQKPEKKPEKPEKKPEKQRKPRKPSAKRTLVEYHDVTKPIAMVDGLSILGRGDVFTKRKWWLPEDDAQITEGSHGITGTMAAQMRRSLEYSKRENRPRIICSSVDQYSVESR